jgi:hypothetical protein
MSENQLNQVSEKSESKFTSGKDSNSGLSASLWEEIGRMKQSSGAGATVDGRGLQHAPDKVPSQDGGTKPEMNESNGNSNSDNTAKVPRDGGVKEPHEDQHGNNTKPEYNLGGKPVGEKSNDADVAGKKLVQEEREGIVKPVKPYDSFDNGIKPIKPNMEDGIVKPGIKKPPIKTEGPVCDKDSLQGYLEFAPLKF